MASITIKDLPANKTLDARAMSAVHGGDGAPWVFGWIRPFIESSPSQVPVINFYQINNFADQMINQFQNISVNNAGANSAIDVNLDGNAKNLGRL